MGEVLGYINKPNVKQLHINEEQECSDPEYVGFFRESHARVLHHAG